MTHSTEPLACSLANDNAAQQALEWADLGRHAVATERLEGEVAMTFRIDLADAVEELAAREAECCGFLSLATTRNANTMRLEITSDHPDAYLVIEALAGTGPS